MTKARAFTIAGLVHLAVATLLAMTLLASEPGTALGSGMVITRTPTPTPHNGDNGDNGDNDHEIPCRLTCTKTANPTEVLPGDLVTLVIEVCNEGDKDCDAQPDIQMHKGVVVSDDLPDELKVVSASASQGRAVVVGDDVRAEFGVLIPGACAELTIVAQVRDDVKLLCTQFTNVATIVDDGDCRATLIVPCLPVVGGSAPRSGQVAPQAVVVGLLVMGAGLLAAGLVLRAKNRVS